MSWALKGLAGPLKDQTFPLKSGLTLGRQGEIVVADGKASSIHARINQMPNGGWILEDNSSKNGTRIAGERVTSANLRPGTAFYIGDQGFEVIEIVSESTVVEPPTVVKTKRYWYDILASFLEENSDRFHDKPAAVKPLTPALILDFVRGIQANSKWVLGYAPRKVGSTSLDLPIWEPGAPAVCFEVFSTTNGIQFKTAHSEMVQLNGESVDSAILRVGDTIRIHETVIEVDFTE